MSNIKISFCAPSIRPQLWKQFCDSLKNTTVPWEVIFVGPLPPVHSDLPSNFRWIDSKVKPSQCTHIAFMEAKGEFISLTADDARYFSPDQKSAADNMVEFIENFPWSSDLTREYAYGFRMFEDGFATETSLTHKLIFIYNATAPLLYPFFTIRKETYLKLGGYDNRFVCGQAENDFLMRVALQIGHSANTLAPKSMVWADHQEGHQNSGSFRKYHLGETELLQRLWLQDNNFTGHRTSPVEQYINDSSLFTKSQGNAGEWS